MKQFRQGDVLLRAVEAIPPRAKPVPPDGDRVVLAYGEVTGHAHAFAAARVSLLREGRTGRSFLTVVEGGARLRHEEHDPILVPAGSYEFIRQREYTPTLVQVVAD
jgi:hypothetical protein